MHGRGHCIVYRVCHNQGTHSISNKLLINFHLLCYVMKLWYKEYIHPYNVLKSKVDNSC